MTTITNTRNFAIWSTCFFRVS